jgi:hypothetical protein
VPLIKKISEEFSNNDKFDTNKHQTVAAHNCKK